MHLSCSVCGPVGLCGFGCMGAWVHVYGVWCMCMVRQVTQAVDVYSFGVLLAFLFTGQDSPRVPPALEVRMRLRGQL
jgi:hypothetical protein